MSKNLGKYLKGLGGAWKKGKKLSKEKKGFDRPADGTYTAKLDEIEVAESEAGNIGIKSQFIISSKGKAHGKTAFRWDGLSDDPDRLAWVYKYLESLGVDVSDLATEDIPDALAELQEEKPTYRIRMKTKDDYQNLYIKKRLEEDEADEDDDEEDDGEETTKRGKKSRDDDDDEETVEDEDVENEEAEDEDEPKRGKKGKKSKRKADEDDDDEDAEDEDDEESKKSKKGKKGKKSKDQDEDEEGDAEDDEETVEIEKGMTVEFQQGTKRMKGKITKVLASKEKVVVQPAGKGKKPVTLGFDDIDPLVD